MTTTFKPGDRVRRITQSWCDIKVGDERVVTEASSNGYAVSLAGHERTYDSSFFELVEAAPEPTPPLTPREAILAEASALITGDRQVDYGPPSVSMQRIATGWEVIFGTTISPWQVAAAMAWLKIARGVEAPKKRDSWVDGAGYMAIAGEVAGA